MKLERSERNMQRISSMIPTRSLTTFASASFNQERNSFLFHLASQRKKRLARDNENTLFEFDAHGDLRTREDWNGYLDT